MFPHNFTKVELNIFMYILSLFNNKDATIATISYKKLRDMAGFNSRRTYADFDKSLEKFCSKIESFVFTAQTPDCDFDLHPFSTIQRNLTTRVLTIAINPYAKALINACKGYTQFDLREYISLKSKFSKCIFVYLKQFRSTGVWHVRIEDFKERLGISTYSNNNCIQRCIYPAIKELSDKKIFSNLSVKIETSHAQGNPVKALLFTFTPEKIGTISRDDTPMSSTDKENSMPAKESSQHSATNGSNDNIKPSNSTNNRKWTSSKKKKGTSFHNFEERTYDFDELMAILGLERR